MNITLFGGSFNPPHLGHSLVIEDYLTFTKTVDQVWILPTYHHTFGKHLATSKHRLAMSCHFINSLPTNLKSRVKLCPIEIDLKLSGQTHQTIQVLKSKTDYVTHVMSLKNSLFNVQYSFLMGSDQLPSFHKWGHYRKLLKLINFLVYPRANHPLENLQPGMKPFLHKDQTITNFSSTMVRNRLNQGLPVSSLTPTPVNSYLTKHQLYTKSA